MVGGGSVDHAERQFWRELLEPEPFRDAFLWSLPPHRDKEALYVRIAFTKGQELQTRRY